MSFIQLEAFCFGVTIAKADLIKVCLSKTTHMVVFVTVLPSKNKF